MLKQTAMQAQIVEDTSALNEVATSEQNLNALQTPGPRQSLAGLKVHARTYWLGRLECLRGSYPVLVRALGPAFEHLAKDYMLNNAPREINPAALVKGFPSYLLDVSSNIDAMMAVAADIAAFELAASTVLEERRLGGQPLANSRQIFAISLEQFADLRINVATSLRFMFLDHACYLKSFCELAGIYLEWSGSMSKYIIIHRKYSTVAVRYINQACFHLLRRLSMGMSVREALKYCPDLMSADWSLRLATARECCCEWADEGLLGPLLTRPREGNPER